MALYDNPAISGTSNITAQVVLASSAASGEIITSGFIKPTTRLLKMTDTGGNTIYLFNWPCWGIPFKNNTGHEIVQNIYNSNQVATHPLEYADTEEVLSHIDLATFTATDNTKYGPYNVLHCVPINTNITFAFDISKTFSISEIKERKLKIPQVLGLQTGHRPDFSGTKNVYFHPIKEIAYSGTTYYSTTGCSAWAKPGIKSFTSNCLYDKSSDGNYFPRINLELQYSKDNAFVSDSESDNADYVLQNQENSSNTNPFNDSGYANIILESEHSYVEDNFPRDFELFSFFNWDTADQTGQMNDYYPTLDLQNYFTEAFSIDRFIKTITISPPDSTATSGNSGYICAGADTGGNEPTILFQSKQDLQGIGVAVGETERKAYIFTEGEGTENITSRYSSSAIKMARLDRPVLLKTVGFKYKSNRPVSMSITFDDGTFWNHLFPGDESGKILEKSAVVGRRTKICQVHIATAQGYSTKRLFEIHSIELGF